MITQQDDTPTAICLPMRFKLFPSRRSNILATPCLTVQLNNVEIVRLLDPELGEGFVSAARLFVASGIPLLDALVRFNLHKPDYDVHLGRLAPFDDIWVPLSSARVIADQLGVGEALARLLDPATRTAWSLDNGDEGGMLHNWKIPQEYLAASSYSADTMQSVEFGRIAVLQPGSQIRTPIDRPALQDIFSQRFAAQEAFFGNQPEHLLSILISWLTLLYEKWSEETEADATLSTDPDTMKESKLQDNSLDSTYLFRSLVSASIVAGQLPAQEERSISLTFGEMRVGKHDLDPASTATKLAFVDLFSRLVLKDYASVEKKMRDEPAPAAVSKEAVPPDSGLEGTSTAERIEAPNTKDQIADLYKRVLALEEAASLVGTASPPARPRINPRKQTQVEALAALHPATIILIMIVSYILIQRILDFIETSLRVVPITMRRLSGG